MKGELYAQILISVLEKRYTEDVIMTHNSDNLPVLIIKKANVILCKLDFFDVLRIDQVQFFDDALIKFVYILADQIRGVILSVLDVDYLGKTFNLFAHLN